MPARSYGEACAVAHALDLVGERWALLVIRELLLGAKRFSDLREGLPGASPNVLAQRLRELEDDGVVRRRKLGPPVSSSVYELTEWGRELEPVVVQLGRWGARSALRQRRGSFSPDSVLLALRSAFDESAAAWASTYEVRLDEHVFEVRVTDGRISVRRGEATRPDAVIETDRHTFARLITGAETLEDSAKRGRTRLEGDARAVRKLFNAVRRPERVGAPSVG